MAISNFSEVITTEAQLRDIIDYPIPAVVDKTIDHLDAHCQVFIAASPFVLIASADAQGRMDVSPKGDPPGFVQVLDDQTLAIPDRPGNRRADTFSNILQNPQVGLFFLIPGKRETLRVSGRAMLVRDRQLREGMAIKGKVPELALVVAVEEVFFHCAKCVIRSQLWDDATGLDQAGLPSLAQAMIDHSQLDTTLEDMQAIIDDAYANNLY